MYDHARFALLIGAMLGATLMAGTFYTFSVFVMRALARLPAAQGVAAMQSINVAVINPLFLGVFVGTAVASLAIIIESLARWRGPGSAFALAGGTAYVIGTFLVTMRCNVPLNNTLAALSPTDAQSVSRWSQYARVWTRWNHVRTFAAIVATGCFSVALRC